MLHFIRMVIQLRFYFSILCVLIFIQSAPVYAIDYFDTKITDDEKAVFAFLRKGDVIPDYEALVKSGHIYRNTPLKYRDEILLQEELRLGRGYSEFNPDQHFLNVELPVYVKFLTKDSGEHIVVFSLYDGGGPDKAPIFDYPYTHDQKILLLVDDIMTFAKLPVPDEQYGAIKDKARASEGEWFRSLLVMRVRVYKADSKMPQRVENEMGWVMYGKIAHIRCMLPPSYSGEVVLWDWVAPWHEATYKEETMPEDKKYPHPFDLFK